LLRIVDDRSLEVAEEIQVFRLDVQV
jgi:hypothetical protein